MIEVMPYDILQKDILYPATEFRLGKLHLIILKVGSEHPPIILNFSGTDEIFSCI